jgi:hypothetical protein
LAAPAAIFIGLRATPAALVRLRALRSALTPFAAGRRPRLARWRRNKLRRRLLWLGVLLLLELSLLLLFLHGLLLSQLPLLNRLMLAQLPLLNNLLLTQLLLLHRLLLPQSMLALQLQLLPPALLVQPLRL